MHISTVRNAQCFVAKTTKHQTSKAKCGLLQSFLKKNQTGNSKSSKWQKGKLHCIINILSTSK